jgi:DNA transposition AAA+ family ATPase
MTTMEVRRANKDLQRKLRRMIDFASITEIAAEFGIGREALAKYLADLPVQGSTFAGIEASVAAAELRIGTRTDDK